MGGNPGPPLKAWTCALVHPSADGVEAVEYFCFSIVEFKRVKFVARIHFAPAASDHIQAISRKPESDKIHGLMSQTSFFSSQMHRMIVLVLLFSVALVIRLYDLTDLPLDFHPTRQLLSAIKARGLYYETQPDGISTWQLETGIRQAKLKADVEPVVFEKLVAFTYQFTGEKFWVARIYSSLFWLIGGIFLFLLVRESCFV